MEPTSKDWMVQRAIDAAPGAPSDVEQVVSPLPWLLPPLNRFSIVGMNHYHVNGRRHLFVAMIGPSGYCIKAEGADEQDVFRQLALHAMG